MSQALALCVAIAALSLAIGLWAMWSDWRDSQR